MKRSTRALMLSVLFALFAQGSQAAVVYENDFNIHANVIPGSPFSDNGWGAYVTRADGSVTDETNTDPIVFGGTSRGAAAANTYLWVAPKSEAGNTNETVTSFVFSMDLGTPVSLAELESISVLQAYDGSVSDPAAGRFAIQIGTVWYASSSEWTSTLQTGAPSAKGTVSVLSGIDFTDGNNWIELTAVVGSVGSGNIALGSAAGGTLTGDISAFGIFTEHGSGGDHIRIDDFQVATADPAASYIADARTNWESPDAWSDGNAATAGIIYYASKSVVLETPATTSTFPGTSLNMVGPQRMEIMVSGVDVITIDNLTMDNADLAAGVVDAGEAQIDGQITIISNSMFSGAADNSRDLRVLSKVIGGSTVSVELAAPAKTIYIDNANNEFSGTWIVSGGTAVFATGPAVGPASIEVQSAGKLGIAGGWDGLSSGGYLTVADSAGALVDLGSDAWTVSGLMIGGSNVVEGSSYTVAELNAIGANAVFTGTGTLQVGPPPPPPVPEFLVGWERWTNGTSVATIQTNGITGVATNSNFVLSNYAACNDGTFGTLPSPAASSDTSVVWEGLRQTAVTDTDIIFVIENTSGSPVDLGTFHFDALAKTVSTGPDTWMLEVVSGDLTIGGVATNDLAFVTATGDLADYDVDLTGLPDYTLDAGGSVVFRLEFTGGSGAASIKLDVDNVAITKAVSLVPTEPPVMGMEISGGNMVITWPESGFKLQTRQDLQYGEWVDYPGGNTSPVTMPLTNDVEFLRLVWP